MKITHSEALYTNRWMKIYTTLVDNKEDALNWLLDNWDALYIENKKYEWQDSIIISQRWDEYIWLIVDSKKINFWQRDFKISPYNIWK